MTDGRKYWSPERRRRKSEERKGKYMGEDHANWKGGRYYASNGYVLVLCPNHPRAGKNGYVFEHILVLEEKLGRPLMPSEECHHINGIRDDNRTENLSAFASRAEHTAHHNQMGPLK